MKPSPTEKKLLHYTGKAIADYKMINTGDQVMVCLSGGKDSFTLLKILNLLRLRTNNKFTILAFMLDQGLSNWDDSKVEQWLIENKIPYEILRRDTLSIIKEKISAKDNYCAFCSRLRRGVIYSYAKEHGLIKIALGHHRDDLISSLLMSILYNGNISSMAAKRLTDDKRHIIVRPLAYCQESDIIKYAAEQNFPIINAEKLCIFKNDAVRRDIKKLIAQLAKDNPKIPSNILHALKCVKPSKLLDKNLWDFKNLESSVIASEAKQSPD